MKQCYFKSIFVFFILLASHSQGQTYNLDTSGLDTCPEAGIFATIDCSFTETIILGVFTDTNVVGVELDTMSLIVYVTCDGPYEVFLNGTSLGPASTILGTTCQCGVGYESDNIIVTLTPAITAAYIIGGDNTITAATLGGGSCFFGADVTVTTSNLGVEDFNTEKIKAFPNPASNYITITGYKNTEHYRIYNILGNEILKGSIIDNGKIDVRNLNIGLYFLKFDNGTTIKFIKE